MIEFQENTWTEGQRGGGSKGQKYGQTLFYRTLPATTRCPKILVVIKNRISKGTFGWVFNEPKMLFYQNLK